MLEETGRRCAKLAHPVTSAELSEQQREQFVARLTESGLGQGPIPAETRDELAAALDVGESVTQLLAT
ncbi:hypothetical protein F7R91_33145 [Streptomyces luteolifulvus]|jgi:hypothetical protein|uniref:Uncharacterized protein n=1 Tax=Streptomyces luteolifulvus TaxID=2615112 RepID=A0A6H9US60_9ACTN|nr:hypothetical protein [Streptomyces luteolifulvus]KAB1141270.1 hypothetical protein F7R91_33145 [Streptomyces luteolifulvus]